MVRANERAAFNGSLTLFMDVVGTGKHCLTEFGHHLARFDDEARGHPAAQVTRALLQAAFSAVALQVGPHQDSRASLCVVLFSASPPHFEMTMEWL